MGSTGVIDLQPALAHRRHLAEHSHEALLIHSLEQLQGLQAVAYGVLPEPIGLIGPQVTAGDAAAQDPGLSCQLAVGLGLDHTKQQPVGLVAVLVRIQLQQRLGQLVGGDQIFWRHRQGLAEPRHTGGQDPGDDQQAAQPA